MSAMMIRDVTAAMRTESVSVAKNEKTAITPFQKVLEKEKEVYTERTKSSTADRTVSSSDGETALKSIFERASEKYDISYDFLVAVAKAESNFNTKCVSSAGAQGIMQVMPEEQKGLGIKDPFDAKQNIMGAAKLLKAHLEKFDGDYTLAAAAYNAGSGTVKKYGGVPPYKETQNYVKKIKKYMEEGVTVPDKKVTVSENKEEKTATETDLEKVTVVVGTGDNTITMTYGAYLKYIEAGNSGVG